MVVQGKVLAAAGRSPDDPRWMVWRGPVPTPGESVELQEVLDDETAVAISAEMAFRRAAEYAAEHGDDTLTAQIEAFLTDVGLWSGQTLPSAESDTAVAVPTETVFRGLAKYATEHGDDTPTAQ